MKCMKEVYSKRWYEVGNEIGSKNDKMLDDYVAGLTDLFVEELEWCIGNFL